MNNNYVNYVFKPIGSNTGVHIHLGENQEITFCGYLDEETAALYGWSGVFFEIPLLDYQKLNKMVLLHDAVCNARIKIGLPNTTIYNFIKPYIERPLP